MANDKLPFPEFKPGWVWLVGAGPGDAGLLTLHGAHALKHADIIVYDALVGEKVLELANEKAELEYAGKRGGKPSPKQRDISLRLIELARQGKKVCRLKGGDPLVFARGAEEALALEKHNVPFRIVPGISAGIAASAYSGIPLTHRDVNQHVTFLTGHDSSGQVPNIDWKNIAQSQGVIVMYMAMKNIEAIAEKLIRFGRDENEPVAFVCNATHPNQRIYETVLGGIKDMDKAELQVPAIVIVGEIVRLRHQLRHELAGGLADTRNE